MQDILFLIAGALALVWFLVHLFVGGRQVAQPLLASDSLPPLVKQTQYLCWHLTSAGILAQPLLFGLAVGLREASLGLAASILAALFFVTGVTIIIRLRLRHRDLPQGWLFLPVAVLGLVGYLAA